MMNFHDFIINLNLIDYFSWISLVIIALLMGSFINMLSYRLPNKEEIFFSRSYCPKCKHKLNFMDLIPLFSYVLHFGRCRYCRELIPKRYFFVEIATVILFIMIYLKWGYSIEALVGFLFTIILVVAFLTDLEYWIIPDRLTYPAMLIGLIISFFTVGFKSAFFGGVVFGGILFLAAIISNGGMGGGDIKFATVIGIFTGLEGAIFAFVLSSILGGLLALFLIFFTKADRKTPIKFGLFLSAAAFITYNYSQELIAAYLGLFS